MADFRTHITTSSVLGAGYAGAGMLFGVSYPSCILGGVMCGVAGMLPDLDSGSGRPLRESTAFLAAVTPMLLVDRFRQLGLSPESMVLSGSLMYLAIRFGLYRFLRFYTVHRGMFHSLPAMVIVGQIGFLISGDNDLSVRGYKACALMLGYLSHLILDELYSFEWHAGGWVRIKKSLGTALKLYGASMWANVSTYSKLAFLTFVMLEDPILWDSIERLGNIEGVPMAGPEAKEFTPSRPLAASKPPIRIGRAPFSTSNDAAADGEPSPPSVPRDGVRETNELAASDVPQREILAPVVRPWQTADPHGATSNGALESSEALVPVQRRSPPLPR